MAGKKDRAIVAVISNLTDNQAATLSADIMKAKQKIAPLSRGTAVSCTMASIGSMLQKGIKKIGGK